MIRRITYLIAVAAALSFTASLSQPARAIPNWPPLLNCADVDANGVVNIVDLSTVIAKFGTAYPNDDYQLLYDVAGGGNINISDVAATVADFGQSCPLVDTQVAQAALAIAKYQDQSVAIADGYVQTTQNISGHGVHWMKAELLDGVFDPTQPEGLNYSLGGQLLAAFYIDPLWLPGHEQPPEGFDTNEEMWHHHPGLCRWDGPNGPMVNQNVAEATCLALPNPIWFEDFGWMVHLWAFLSNPMGRFMMENPGAG